MPPPATSTRRSPPVLLINRLITPPATLKDASPSPFTLVLDSLVQPARPLLAEYARRAATGRAPVNVVYVGYETVRVPAGVHVFVKTFRKGVDAVQKEIVAGLKGDQRNLIIIDSLHPLLLPSLPPSTLSAFLSSLLTPTTSILAVLHQDLPLPPPSLPGYPQPKHLLRYLATAILTTRSLPHTLEQKKRADKARPPRRFAWWEDGEGELERGVLVPIGSRSRDGFIVEIEARRKSGRAVGGSVVFRPREGAEGWEADAVETIPGWAAEVGIRPMEDVGEELVTTFELGLTEEQRKKRDEVELPYFDAQKEGGGGGGGRIVYVPEKVDDWDDEEDEI